MNQTNASILFNPNPYIPNIGYLDSHMKLQADRKIVWFSKTDMSSNKIQLNYISPETNSSYLTAHWNFTGAHGNNNNFNFDVSDIHIGLIVSSIGKYINEFKEIIPLINESVPIVGLSSINNDKAVIGVVSYYENTNNINNYRINALGEGGIWISNINGNYNNGDYITSSSITGYGQKQTDDILHNYTVAKITCDCDFSLTKILSQKLQLQQKNDIITVGLVEDRDEEHMIVRDANNNPVYEDALDGSGNQVYVYKFDTRFVDASGNITTDVNIYQSRIANGEVLYIACFVGCTYHCG